MSDTVLKWIAGVASVLCVAAILALLNTWADVRQMKQDLANSVKAERISALEANVENLKEEVKDQDQSHSAMWQAIGRKADK